MFRLSNSFLRMSVILLVLMLGVFVLYKFLGEDKVKNNLSLSNISIQEVLNLYWTASFVGDADTIRQVSAFSPEDMFEDCSEIENPEVKEDDILVLKKESAIEFIHSTNTTKSPYTSENMPSDLKVVSEYIYSSKIPYSKVKIVDEKIYQDEAFLEVIIADHKGNFDIDDTNEKIVFFKRYGDSWKIIGIAGKKTLMTITNEINYARPKPECK